LNSIWSYYAYKHLTMNYVNYLAAPFLRRKDDCASRRYLAE